VAGREERRGECQTRLGFVWRETGAVRNARPSRGQAASHPEEGEVGKDGPAFRLRLVEGLTMEGLSGEEQCCGVVDFNGRVRRTPRRCPWGKEKAVWAILSRTISQNPPARPGLMLREARSSVRPRRS